MLKAKRYDQALKSFDNVVKHKHDWADPFYEKAKIHFMQSQIDLGLQMLEKAFIINPQDRFDFDFNTDWYLVVNYLMNR